MEDFNLLHGLLDTGDYYFIVRQIIDHLDLESLHNWSLVNRTCYSYLKPLLIRKTNNLRRSWLKANKKSSESAIETITGDDINYPTVICDDTEVILVAFEPTRGWLAHVYRTVSLDRKYTQCLYRVDNEDFPWTQFIGNCSLSRKFLIVTPTTPEHELHLWSRHDKEFGKKKIFSSLD